MTIVRSTDSRRARNSDSEIEWRRRPSRRPSRRRIFLASRRVDPLRACTWSAGSPPSSEEAELRARRRRRRRLEDSSSSPPSGSPEDASACSALSSVAAEASSAFLERRRRRVLGSEGVPSVSVLGALSSVGAEASSTDFLERRRRLGVVSSCEALASSSEEPRRRFGFVSGSSKAAGEATSGAAWKTGAWKSSDAAGAMGAFDSVVTILQWWGAHPMPRRARCIAREGRKLSGALVRRCRRLVDRVIARLSSRRHARDIHSPQLSHNTDLHQPMGDTFNLTHPQSQGTIPPKQSDTYVTKPSHNRHFRRSTSVF